jgi:hypothetical protein
MPYKDPERAKAYAKEWREKNRKRINEYRKWWTRLNRSKTREHWQRHYKKVKKKKLEELKAELENPPLLELSDIEIGYIAGLIDGEGTIGIYNCHKSRGTFRPVVQVSNTKPEVLRWFKSKLPFGCLSERHFQFIIVNHFLMLRLLTTIKDSLLIKKKHAELMIEYLKSRILDLRKRKWIFEEGKVVVGRRRVPYTERQLEIVSELKMLNRRNARKTREETGTAYCIGLQERGETWLREPREAMTPTPT